MRELEILAPAKNLECGMAAIEHGADAVYIGASHHGARAAAGNSVEDIAKLCAYAHSFLARVYVTLNTLVYEGEMESVLALVRQLAEARVDALLVQDMGIVDRIANCADDDPLAYFRTRLHASTQTDNRTAEKVRWLHDVGFERVVLQERHRYRPCATSILKTRAWSWKLLCTARCVSASPDCATPRNIVLSVALTGASVRNCAE